MTAVTLALERGLDDPTQSLPPDLLRPPPRATKQRTSQAAQTQVYVGYLQPTTEHIRLRRRSRFPFLGASHRYNPQNATQHYCR